MSLVTTSTLAAGQVDCSTITNIQDCLNRPNATWDGTACYCCSTQGDYYVEGGSGTGKTPTCTKCVGKCGNPKFCKGTIVNSNAVCIENSTTNQWTVVCRNNAQCGGECTGGCGAAEWFAFSQCNIADGVYQCTTSFSQWKSWLFYLLIIILIVIIIIIGCYIVRGWAASEGNAYAVGRVGTQMIAVPVPTEPLAVTTTTTQPITTIQPVVTQPVYTTTYV